MSPLLLPVLAVVAGTISFSSPCCLPMIPGYLSYMSALPVSELGTRSARAVTLRAALMFVAGFTLVFTALGVSFALVGTLLLRNVPVITRSLMLADAYSTTVCTTHRRPGCRDGVSQPVTSRDS